MKEGAGAATSSLLLTGHVEDLKFVPHLKANSLACHSSMDAGRGNKSPKSETQCGITHSTDKVMSAMIPSVLVCPQGPWGDTEEPG